MSDDGGDDSPPRPRRKIKRVVVMSSDSDSDEDVGVAGSRRKKLRVGDRFTRSRSAVDHSDSHTHRGARFQILSDEEGGDSSGSSVVRAGTRRRRTLPKLQDSEAESDSSGWATDSRAAAPSAGGFASDSSEGNSDKCSICLLRFTEQPVGTPESCEHIFCLDCITEWSKNVNTCPVDRMVFNSIVVRACAGGRVLRSEPVKVTERRPSFDIVEDLDIELAAQTVCEVSVGGSAGLCTRVNSVDAWICCRCARASNTRRACCYATAAISATTCSASSPLSHRYTFRFSFIFCIVKCI